jgi:hypothetical protein
VEAPQILSGTEKDCNSVTVSSKGNRKTLKLDFKEVTSQILIAKLRYFEDKTVVPLIVLKENC